MQGGIWPCFSGKPTSSFNFMLIKTRVAILQFLLTAAISGKTFPALLQICSLQQKNPSSKAFFGIFFCFFRIFPEHSFPVGRYISMIGVEILLLLELGRSSLDFIDQRIVELLAVCSGLLLLCANMFWFSETVF